MKQASPVKKATVKSPKVTKTVASSAPVILKNKVETPSPKTTKTAYSAEDFNKKVAEKAYEIYLQRNGAPGSAEGDWIQAEKIVKGL